MVLTNTEHEVVCMSKDVEGMWGEHASAKSNGDLGV